HERQRNPLNAIVIPSHPQGGSRPQRQHDSNFSRKKKLPRSPLSPLNAKARCRPKLSLQPAIAEVLLIFRNYVVLRCSFRVEVRMLEIEQSEQVAECGAVSRDVRTRGVRRRLRQVVAATSGDRRQLPVPLDELDQR